MMMWDVSTAGNWAWFAATLSSRGIQIISRDEGGWCGLPFEDTRFLRTGKIKVVCSNQYAFFFSLSLWLLPR